MQVAQVRERTVDEILCSANSSLSTKQAESPSVCTFIVVLIFLVISVFCMDCWLFIVQIFSKRNISNVSKLEM